MKLFDAGKIISSSLGMGRGHVAFVALFMEE